MEHTSVNMWGEIEQFVKNVEENKCEPGPAKDYIEQIKNILLKHHNHTQTVD